MSIKLPAANIIKLFILFIITSLFIVIFHYFITFWITKLIMAQAKVIMIRPMTALANMARAFLALVGLSPARWPAAAPPAVEYWIPLMMITMTAPIPAITAIKLVAFWTTSTTGLVFFLI